MAQRDDPFRDLCENASDLIQSVSPQGKFLYVNRAWKRTLGYTDQEVDGLNVMDVIHPDSRDHCRQIMGGLLDGASAVDIKTDFITKDGWRVPVEGSASCRFQDGRPVATRGIFRDVSRRRRAEDELDRLFTLSPDLLCIAGTDGYFKRVNPAFEKVLGYRPDELLSRAFVDFIHPDDKQQTMEEVERLAQGHITVDFQNRYRARDGTYRWLSWRSTPLPDRQRIYAVARDITEQKRIQAAMDRQALELARSNADLEEFAYVASHDLRAPLRAIANLSEWIEEDMPDDLPPQVREHLQTLRRRVQRMEQLTADLLAYSRAGREAGHAEEVETGGLVRDIVALLSPPQGIQVRPAPDLPRIRAVRSALEHVFRNLIGNAIKHHPGPEGTVRVEARAVGGGWEFAVSDDGPGIPREDQERIFQMFQTLQARDEVEGSGMGLALVKKIVERHGGTITLESAPGKGATFRFTWRAGAEKEGD